MWGWAGFYWPQVAEEEIDDYVGSCDDCQGNKASRSKRHGTVHPLELSYSKPSRRQPKVVQSYLVRSGLRSLWIRADCRLNYNCQSDGVYIMCSILLHCWNRAAIRQTDYIRHPLTLPKGRAPTRASLISQVLSTRSGTTWMANESTKVSPMWMRSWDLNTTLRRYCI